MDRPKPTADELKEILAAHGKWLRGEEGGSRAGLIPMPTTQEPAAGKETN